MLEELLERLGRKDRRALSRLMTLAAHGEHTDAIRAGLPGDFKRARVVAVTGNSGVGKSTLIGRLIGLLRERGKRVAVLACDPESSLTGGALLGDRVRMPNLAADEGVLIRSLAAVSGHQALAEHLDLLVDLVSAYGFDVVLLETVGAGQGDTAVRDVADVVTLLVQPEIGDELQWEKAGVLEVADVVVVHKADLPGAEAVEAQLRELLNLPGCREVPVLRASAGKGEGLEALWETIEKLPAARERGEADGRSLLRLAQQRLAERFETQRERIGPVLQRWRRREVDEAQAADELLSVLSEEE